MRALVVICAGAFLVSASSEARATSGFPRDIERDLALSYAPPCSLCHDRGKTGSGTVITPFGWAMRGAGLQAGSNGSLAAALATLRANHTDSDGDGTSDVDELVAGTDPNSAAPAAEVGSEPGYGCGGKAPTPRGASLSWAPLVLAGAFVGRRRARPPARARGPVTPIAQDRPTDGKLHDGR